MDVLCLVTWCAERTTSLIIGVFVGFSRIPLNAELNLICHLLALLGGATIVVVSRLRVNLLFIFHEYFNLSMKHTLKSTTYLIHLFIPQILNILHGIKFKYID